jgi:phosphatidylserine/phosphatidylglycerophosphate/cardiolipin synthase-like enzyme
VFPSLKHLPYLLFDLLTRLFDRLKVEHGHSPLTEGTKIQFCSRQKIETIRWTVLGYNYKPLNQVRSPTGILPIMKRTVNRCSDRRSRFAFCFIVEAKNHAELSGSSSSSLHLKTFSVDRARVFIGPFHFDPRSAELSTELGFVIASPALAQQIESAFR